MEANNITYKNNTKGAEQRPSLNLNSQEKKAIITFLKTLTDRPFINNDRFSSPFKQEKLNDS